MSLAFVCYTRIFEFSLLLILSHVLQFSNIVSIVSCLGNMSEIVALFPIQLLGYTHRPLVSFFSAELSYFIAMLPPVSRWIPET